jgi:2-methylisocitrate lyase-like PEP mutase family enzyme
VKHDETLSVRLRAYAILMAAGVYDALTALIAERAGFEALYVSGAGMAHTRLGRPDIGLVSLNEVVQTVALIRDRVGVHLLSMPTPGTATRAQRRTYRAPARRARANAIQLEDQDFPKRCGHLDGKAVIPAQEMAGKIKAAVDARHSAETLIIARTDAIAVEGFDRAMARAALFLEAGADVLFIEAPRERDELTRICARFAKSVPLLANMVEGGKTPILPASELEALGFAVVIFAAGVVRAVARTAEEFYASLKAHGSTAPFRGRMFDFTGLNQLIGTPEMLERGRRYAGLEPESGQASGRR